MRKSRNITRVVVRHYTDNDQTTAYVFWSDGSRTEGEPPGCPFLGYRGDRGHMEALFARALREGLRVEQETW